MPYNKFTLTKAKELGLTTQESPNIMPNLPALEPSQRLNGQLDIAWAVSVGSEKARSEGIIYPLLREIRTLKGDTISLFSGSQFDVDPDQELTGYVDFLISLSTEKLVIEAPVAVITEAKKGDPGEGIGQCAAQMVAAQRFNRAKGNTIPVIYGTVTSGTVWRFLMLEGTTLKIDLAEYPLEPIGRILAYMMWMVRDQSLEA